MLWSRRFREVLSKLSSNSRIAYVHRVKRYFDWLTEAGIAVFPKEEALSAYIAWMSNAGRRESTIKSHLTAIELFYSSVEFPTTSGSL